MRSSAGLLAYGLSLLAAPSPQELLPLGQFLGEWRNAAFVPDYSGGSAVDLHHLPRVRTKSDADDRDYSLVKA